MGDHGLLEGLNPEQLQAVRHGGGPLLVLAGAGSGKTRVITRRIAYLIERGVSPAKIIALTFTNKAAREMRARVEEMRGRSSEGLFLGTFHAWGLAILRRHAEELGLTRSFAILDRSEQARLLQTCLDELGLSGDELSPRRASSLLSRARNNLRAIDDSGPLADVSALYEKGLRQRHAVDFDDLLLLPLELFARRPDLNAHYRPLSILVDEFQDTNPAQARLLELLWPEGEDVCVVGDEDQSIYAFRGASVSNILEFTGHHPRTEVVRLERNYRSSSSILRAASALVSRNQKRLGKTLKAERQGGDAVRVSGAPTAEAEAELVAAEVAAMSARFGASEVAVLYRTNAQARLIEEALVQRGLPYQVVKGLRFYERREIRDVLAFLRLVANRNDDLAFDRVVNVPPRGIGPAVLDEVSRVAVDGSVSRFRASERLAAEGTVAGRRLGPFVELIKRLERAAGGATPGELIASVVEEARLQPYFERLSAQDGVEGRAGHVGELVDKAQSLGTEKGAEPLLRFLDDIVVASETEGEAGKGVALMTLHNAKGLEFDGVVITGLEDGLLPHSSLGGDDGDAEAGSVEEERRLLYVGMTRARTSLVLTYADERRLYGESRVLRPSPFLAELAVDAVAGSARAAIANRTAPGRPASGAPASVAPPSLAPVRPRPPRKAETTADVMPYRRGGWVRHPEYGEGMVIEREGGGDALKVTVRFSSGLRKKLHPRYAGLIEIRR